MAIELSTELRAWLQQQSQLLWSWAGSPKKESWIVLSAELGQHPWSQWGRRLLNASVFWDSCSSVSFRAVANWPLCTAHVVTAVGERKGCVTLSPFVDVRCPSKAQELASWSHSLSPHQELWGWSTNFGSNLEPAKGCENYCLIPVESVMILALK